MKYFVLFLYSPVFSQDYPIPAVLIDPANNYNYADYNYDDTDPIIPEDFNEKIFAYEYIGPENPVDYLLINQDYSDGSEDAYDLTYTYGDFNSTNEKKNEISKIDFQDVDYSRTFDGVNQNSSRFNRPENNAVEAVQAKNFLTSDYSCYTKSAIGSTTAQTIQNFSGGIVKNCRTQGQSSFCRLEIRSVGGEVRQIHTGCTTEDYCLGIRNFVNRVQPFRIDLRFDQCKPEFHQNGGTQFRNSRYRNHESFCRTCFYMNDGSTDGTNRKGLYATGSDLFILDGEANPAPLHATSINDWPREFWTQLAYSTQTN